MSVSVTDEVEQELAEILSHYPDDSKLAAVLPVLHVMQREVGHVSYGAMAYVADLLSVPPSSVAAVATFYPMFYTEPVGKYVIKVCSTLSCALCGSRQLFDHLRHKLGVGLNETTADQRFTLSKTECLAACGTAPVMMVNETMYENLTPEMADEIIDGLE